MDGRLKMENFQLIGCSCHQHRMKFCSWFLVVARKLHVKDKAAYVLHTAYLAQTYVAVVNYAKTKHIQNQQLILTIQNLTVNQIHKNRLRWNTLTTVYQYLIQFSLVFCLVYLYGLSYALLFISIMIVSVLKKTHFFVFDKKSDIEGPKKPRLLYNYKHNYQFYNDVLRLAYV